MTNSNTTGGPDVSTFGDPSVQGALLAGRYRLGRRIGNGGMAHVFAATDEVLHRPVALKVFRFEADTAQDRTRIQTEARLLASLSHPGLVTVFDASIDGAGHDGRPFIVMELIAGPSLRDHLAQRSLDSAQAAHLGVDLAAALGHVHGHGIVHRDVKPANILLDATVVGAPGALTAKLADFGIARLLDATRLTAVGTTIGTANYLSPEQVEGRDIGPASDIYSLGLVLIECLTGQVAYPGTGVEAAVARLHRPPAIPGAHGAAWAELLEAMTARAADLRPSAADAGSALKALTGGQVEQGPLTPTPTPITEPTLTMNIEPATGTATRDLSSTLPRAASRAQLMTRLETATGLDIARPRWAIYTCAALALVLAALVISLVVASQAGTPMPKPHYPSVPGQLGRDLQQLQKAVG